jgi:Ser/Thr protein kinase RdoA (MazF antagonist)
MSDDLEILSAWHIGPVLATATPTHGTINRTLLVDSGSGDYVLRAYRHAERAPVVREHALIAHAIAHGLPAVAPLPLPGGATILEREGRFYALFPRAPGAQIEHCAITAEHYMAMGAFLAQVHIALRGFPIEYAARRDFTTDRAATLAEITQIEAAVRARPILTELDQRVLAQLAGRRAWIAQAPADRLPDVSTLEQQVIHGDYQETNLFFQDSRVVAIIDWDQSYLAPRAWEIARTLDLVCDFDLESCRAFLAGYRAHMPLESAELDRAAACYGLMRAHDLWLYRAIYFEENQRKRQFVSHGEFVPLVERWAALNEKLRIVN